MYENMIKILVPIFYFDQMVEVDDDLAPKIVLIQNLPDLNKKFSFALIVFGSSLVAIGIIFMVFIKDKPKGKVQTYQVTCIHQDDQPLKQLKL